MSDGTERWAGRRQARAAALQALYEVEVGGLTVTEALGVLDRVGEPEAPALGQADRAFAAVLARGVIESQAALDERIATAARHWRVERMAALDRLVLRLAVHEWLAHPKTPPRVVINEAIELARAYSGEDAAKFVNGVLDGVFRALKEDGKVVE
ncbi:MAG: transcription antitermination factor NusB [Vicinamibacterales bacterium]